MVKVTSLLVINNYDGKDMCNNNLVRVCEVSIIHLEWIGRLFNSSSLYRNMICNLCLGILGWLGYLWLVVMIGLEIVYGWCGSCLGMVMVWLEMVWLENGLLVCLLWVGLLVCISKIGAPVWKEDCSYYDWFLPFQC